MAQPNNYEIRFADLKDIDQIYSLERISFRNAYPPSLILQLIKDRNSLCYVIEVEQNILGMAFALMRSKNKGQIVSVAIHPQHRNCGYGSLLVARLIQDLKERGSEIIELEVRISNAIAQKLYKKFNFKIKKTKTHYYPDGEDAYFMCYSKNEE